MSRRQDSRRARIHDARPGRPAEDKDPGQMRRPECCGCQQLPNQPTKPRLLFPPLRFPHKVHTSSWYVASWSCLVWNAICGPGRGPVAWSAGSGDESTAVVLVGRPGGRANCGLLIGSINHMLHSPSDIHAHRRPRAWVVRVAGLIHA